MTKISVLGSRSPVAQDSVAVLREKFGHVSPEEADVIVALGGDGFMLQTLHETQALDAPVYRMNRGTIGFLMNSYGEADLVDRLIAAERAEINPLAMRATHADGRVSEALATKAIFMGPPGLSV